MLQIHMKIGLQQQELMIHRMTGQEPKGQRRYTRSRQIQSCHSWLGQERRLAPRQHRKRKMQVRMRLLRKTTGREQKR